MKTLKFFIFLSLISAYTVNPANAQNRVVKTEFTARVNGETFPYLDDYLGGDIVFKSMEMSHNWVVKLKKATILGYLDVDGTIPSGNVYEVTQVTPGLSFLEANLHFRLNGKLIGVLQFSWHMTTNAKGDITAVVDKVVANCFN
jgi:hypothetical protein